jgi:hypothetical protein
MLCEADLLKECEVSRLRRGGPGGQHRNKVETAVSIVHRVTAIRAEANERRSQAENRRRAIHRLRIRLAIEIRTTANAEPSELWKSRVQAGRLAVRETHDDYPNLVAEALNKLADCDYDFPTAALSLATSTSQLSRFLKQNRQVWQRVAAERKTRDLPILS